jgi:HlyD family secretion protein
MGQLAVGLPVRITLDPYPDESFRGEIVRVAETVSDIQEKNRTVEVEVELVTPEGLEIRPGTSADVEVILESKKDVLRVPSHALLEGDKVLVLVGDLLEERDLEIGIRNWDFAQVVSGLSPGESVVISLDREEVKAGALAFEGKPEE